jgi:hypothetical protein
VGQAAPRREAPTVDRYWMLKKSANIEMGWDWASTGLTLSTPAEGRASID